MPEPDFVRRATIVIYNPTAGRGRAETLRQRLADQLGPHCEWRPTAHAGHATELAQQAAEQAELVVAYGGDGTVSDVSRGLAGTQAILGIIPVGTGNDVSRNLGIPLDPLAAAEVLRCGTVRRIDIGTANGTPFINNAGLGFDAAVMQRMNRSIRFCRGLPAFVLATLLTLPRFRPFELTTTADEQPPRTRFVLLVAVLNGRVTGAGMRFAPTAQLDDGRLDVLIFQPQPIHCLLRLLPKVIRGTHLGCRGVEYFTAAKLRLNVQHPQPMNLDGDVGSEPVTAVEIAVQPCSQAVLVPA